MLYEKAYIVIFSSFCDLIFLFAERDSDNIYITWLVSQLSKIIC